MPVVKQDLTAALQSPHEFRVESRDAQSRALALLARGRTWRRVPLVDPDVFADQPAPRLETSGRAGGRRMRRDPVPWRRLYRAFCANG
jgi:hypothetical protein